MKPWRSRPVTLPWCAEKLPASRSRFSFRFEADLTLSWPSVWGLLGMLCISVGALGIARKPKQDGTRLHGGAHLAHHDPRHGVVRHLEADARQLRLGVRRVVKKGAPLGTPRSVRRR